MSKQILPNELAEIVAALLVNPSILKQNLDPEKHQAFMLDIGHVIQNHYGGRVNWVNGEESAMHYLDDMESSPTLSVGHDPDLPDNHVWQYHDLTGWDEPEDNDEQERADAVRKQLQACLLQDEFSVPFKLQEKAYEGPGVSGKLVLDTQGLSICLDGHTDFYSEDSQGFPVFIELYEGEVNTRIYAEAGKDDPTHNICLKNARNQNRPDD